MPGNIGIVASSKVTPSFNPLSDWSLPPLHAFSTADPFWTPPADGGAVSAWRNGGSAMKGAYIGAKGLVCPGNTTTARTDCAIIADSAVTRPTGDLEIIVKATATDWTPTAGKVLVLSGDNGAYATINWYLYYNTDGTLTFARPPGGTARVFTSSAATGLTDGSTKWIRVTYDQDNGAGNAECKFYLSDDGSSWSQLGTTQTYASTSAGNSNTAGITIGHSVSGTFPHAGTIHRVIAKDGIGGTTFLDVDFETATEDATFFTESSSNAATVTISSVLRAAYIDDDGLRLPGVASNNASTPDSAALDITGDITVVADVTMADWTPSAVSFLVHKWTTASNNSYSLRVLTSGILRFSTTADGSTVQSNDSTVAPTVANGDRLRVAVTLDVDDGAGNRVCKFWTSTDGTTWAQLGSTVNTAGTTSIYSGSSILEIGGSAAANFVQGTFHGAKIYNGIRDLNADTGGTLAFNADFEAATPWVASFTESSANAATVTINNTTDLRQATGAAQPSYDAANAAFNNAPTVYFTTDDALIADVADQAAPNYYVMIAAMSSSGNGIQTMGIGASTANGWGNSASGTTMRFRHGSSLDTASGLRSSDTRLIVLKQNDPLSEININGVNYATGTAGTSSLTMLSLGAANSAISTFGNYMTGDIHTMLVFKSDPRLQPEWADFEAYVESTIGIDVTPAPVTLQAPTLLDSALYSPTNTCTSASISPSANSLLIITCVSGAAAGTFAFSSTTLSNISSWGMIQQSSGNERVGILWARITGSPGTGTITIGGFGTPGTTRAAMHVMEVVGAKNIRQTKVGTTTSASPSVTLDYAPLASSLVIGAIGLYGVTIPPGANFTELSESNANRALQTQYDLTNATTTVNWSLGASTLVAMAAIEITD